MMAEPAEMEGIAVTRDRRSNAGARMSRLIEAEDDDDFYKTTYGGFAEEEDDMDYKSEESGSDITDSDIDINEDDELKSDMEDDKEGKDKKKSSHAYKEPKKVTDSTEQSTPKPKPERVKLEKQPYSALLETSIEKKSLRKSTAENSKSTEGTIREREAKAMLLKQIAEKKKVAEVRRLTQEELLAEAKITEEINLAALETYQRMELEKKRVRVHRQADNGPLIRYRSVTVPAITVLPEPDISVDDGEISELDSKTTKTNEKCSRNYITFTDDRLFRQYFPQQRSPRPASKSICLVTGLPAKYFDPLTQSPYATAEAFKILRESYHQRIISDKQDSELDSKRRSRSSVFQ